MLRQHINLNITQQYRAQALNVPSVEPPRSAVMSSKNPYNPAHFLLQLIKFWDWTTGSERLSYTSGHFDNVFQARIMPESSNSTVVSCAADGQVRAAQIQPCGGPVATTRLARHRGRAHKLALEPRSAHCFLSCGEDGEVRHFDLREQPPASRRLLVCRAVMVSVMPLAQPAARTLQLGRPHASNHKWCCRDKYDMRTQVAHCPAALPVMSHVCRPCPAPQQKKLSAVK